MPPYSSLRTHMYWFILHMLLSSTVPRSCPPHSRWCCLRPGAAGATFAGTEGPLEVLAGAHPAGSSCEQPWVVSPCVGVGQALLDQILLHEHCFSSCLPGAGASSGSAGSTIGPGLWGWGSNSSSSHLRIENSTPCSGFGLDSFCQKQKTKKPFWPWQCEQATA